MDFHYLWMYHLSRFDIICSDLSLWMNPERRTNFCDIYHISGFIDIIVDMFRLKWIRFEDKKIAWKLFTYPDALMSFKMKVSSEMNPEEREKKNAWIRFSHFRI